MKLLIFTYAPAGLGHLRVTDALVDSRPKKYPYLMLGSYDRFITSIHRFTSTNFLAKWLFMLNQYGIFEDIFTDVYRWFLEKTSGQIYQQLVDLIGRRKDVEEIWIVATHFGMAHQIGAVKERIAKETGVKIRVIVQVTDDTSQHIWCIRGADLTFVPSELTKKKLETYAKSKKMSLNFAVTPYPICPALTEKLGSNLGSRHTTFSDQKTPINVSVPISGAAVGLKFLTKLIKAIAAKSERFHFWILAKKSMQTENFLAELSSLANVHLVTGRNDNEMISLYEVLYQNNLMHLEITKPSEQAFKGILPPTCVGGSILLFTTPVGRQEYENMEFLMRHGLMPGSQESIPRAIKLPKDPMMAADFVLWCLESGLFGKMSSNDFQFSAGSIASGEVGPNGATEFWKKVEESFS